MSESVWFGPVDVYTVRDQSGLVIYVGISGCVKNRFATHKNRSPWWSPTNFISIESYPDREAALDREAELIYEHRPPFNKANREKWRYYLDDVELMLDEGMTLARIQAALGISAAVLASCRNELLRKTASAV